MRKNIFSVIVLMLFVTGCAYQTAVDVSPAYNIYSSYDNKIPGNWALYVDANDFEERNYKFSGIACAAHKYPLDLSGVFRLSAIKTIENVVENVHLIDSPIPTDQLSRDGLTGLIILKGEDIDVDLKLIPGFWSNSVDAEVELAVSIVVNGINGRLLGTTVSEDGEAEAAAGGFCEGATDALGEAAGDSMKNTLERVAERLSNAPKLRQVF